MAEPPQKRLRVAVAMPDGFAKSKPRPAPPRPAVQFHTDFESRAPKRPDPVPSTDTANNALREAPRAPTKSAPQTPSGARRVLETPPRPALPKPTSKPHMKSPLARINLNTRKPPPALSSDALPPPALPPRPNSPIASTSSTLTTPSASAARPPAPNTTLHSATKLLAAAALRPHTPTKPLRALAAPPSLKSKGRDKGKDAVRISDTRIARATNPATANGTAELFELALQAAGGHEVRSWSERELARGVETSPRKKRKREYRGKDKGAEAEGAKREKLGLRARAVMQDVKMDRQLRQGGARLSMGRPDGVWTVSRVLHPARAERRKDSGGARAVFVRCAVEEGEAIVLLAECAMRVGIGSVVRVWGPAVVEAEGDEVVICTRYEVDGVVAGD